MADDPVTLAVVAARMVDLREDFAEMRAEVRAASAQSVSRGEWGQRNNHVDTRIASVDSRVTSVGREVGDLRAMIESRRAPWWSTWAVVLAGAGFAWSILGPVVRAG